MKNISSKFSNMKMKEFTNILNFLYSDSYVDHAKTQLFSFPVLSDTVLSILGQWLIT